MNGANRPDGAYEAAVEDVTAHLTSERQAWLFGAGISCRSGLPLMSTLTELVASEFGAPKAPSGALFAALRASLPDEAHVEHLLSHLGDLIALAERSRDQCASLGVAAFDVKILREVHGSVRDCIRSVIQRGYHPADAEKPVRIASPDDYVVRVDHHRSFIQTLFAARDKTGRAQRPIQFFTSNYDTLLEDAMALEGISFTDGFSGGAMAYWSPETSYSDAGSGGRALAQIFKLHGSVDWHGAENGAVIRCRDGCGYPARAGNVLIYPQSTKYQATQHDPFATLFERLRRYFSSPHSNVLAVCGYSFGDEHIDLEIERAMSHSDCKTVVIAFVKEIEEAGKSKLPSRLSCWLKNGAWGGRVFALTDKGLYHGGLDNLYLGPDPLSWWTFEGLIGFLGDGPRIEKEAPPPVPAADLVEEDEAA